jgi:hypothetical protein
VKAGDTALYDHHAPQSTFVSSCACRSRPAITGAEDVMQETYVRRQHLEHPRPRRLSTRLVLPVVHEGLSRVRKEPQPATGGRGPRWRTVHERVEREFADPNKMRPGPNSPIIGRVVLASRMHGDYVAGKLKGMIFPRSHPFSNLRNRMLSKVARQFRARTGVIAACWNECPKRISVHGARRDCTSAEGASPAGRIQRNCPRVR